MNAILIVALSAPAVGILIWAGISPAIALLAATAIGGFVYFTFSPMARRGADRPILRFFLTLLLRGMYGVRITGLEHIAKAQGGAMVVANHQSFLDGVLLATFLPGMYSFVVNRFMAGHWWARPFLALVDTHTLDADSPMAIKVLVKILRSGGRMVIFPEGRITITGALMKIHEGPALIADRAGAMIIPVRIEGALATGFSRMTDKIKPRLFPRITLAVLPPRRLDIPPGLDGRLRRRAAGQALERIMVDMMYEGADRAKTLPQAVRDARAVFGGGRVSMLEQEGKNLTYTSLLKRAGRIGGGLAKEIGGETTVGLLTRNSPDAVVAALGIQEAGATVAFLNPLANLEDIIRAARLAGIKLVVTHRHHSETGDALAKAGLRTLFAEDLERVGSSCAGANSSPASPAVAFFSKDSDGKEKWSIYSHTAMLANIHRLNAALDIGPGDTVFSAPWMGDYAGYTLGTLAPLVLGIRSFQFDIDSSRINAPAGVYESNSTIVFGTPDIIAELAASAHPYDLANVRRTLVVAKAPPREEDMERLASIASQKFWLVERVGADIVLAEPKG